MLIEERKDTEKAKISINIAEERLSEAENSLNSGIYSGAIILAYTSMFHAARALLFRDGFVEKSHACLTAYLREKYVNSGKIEQKYLTILNNARFERHDVLYGLEAGETQEEAEYIIRNAKEFLSKIKGYLK